MTPKLQSATHYHTLDTEEERRNKKTIKKIKIKTKTCFVCLLIQTVQYKWGIASIVIEQYISPLRKHMFIQRKQIQG